MPFWLTSIFSRIGIKGFIAIGAGIALAICWLGWKHAANQRDDQIRRNGELNLKLATSNQSISMLEATINQMNAEADARAAEYAKVKQEAAAQDAELARQAKASQGQIDKLKALAQAKGTCPVPKELSDALSGL